MYILLTILIILACILLTLVVLIQNPKGGGIASNFASSTQIMGVKKTSDVVEKATWILAVTLISLTLLTNFFRPEAGESGTVKKSLIEDQVQGGTPGQQPQAPAQQQPQQAPPQGE
jgi:preprotein translocase subunit SecG